MVKETRPVAEVVAETIPEVVTETVPEPVPISEMSAGMYRIVVAIIRGVAKSRKTIT